MHVLVYALVLVHLLAQVAVLVADALAVLEVVDLVVLKHVRTNVA